MSIALYDSDYTRFSRHSLPSYYLMKIASYFKSRHEIVKLITDLQRADLYSKLYYNQDTIAPLETQVRNFPDVEYSGFRFNGGIWAPLPPEIQRMRADASIYPDKPVKETDYWKLVLNKQIYHSHILLDSDELPAPGAKGFFFHDYNIFAREDWKERIDECRALIPKKSGFGVKYPQYIPDYESLAYLGSFPIDNIFSVFRVDFDITKDQFIDFLKNSKSSLHGIITWCINNKPDFQSVDAAMYLLRFEQMYFLSRVYNRKFVLYNKGVCLNPNLDSFFTALHNWINKIYREPGDTTPSFYDYLCSKPKSYSHEPEYLRKEALKILLTNSVAKDFAKINPNKILEQGGEWPYDAF